MDSSDLKHLVDTYLGEAGKPPCDPGSSDAFVLPLTEDRQLGVQWQPGETLLFANAGYVAVHQSRGDAGDDEDDDEEDQDHEDAAIARSHIDLGVDQHGRWSLLINGLTSLATLCLHAPQHAFGLVEFGAAVARFRSRFQIWAATLDRHSPADVPAQLLTPEQLVPRSELLNLA